MDMRVVNPTCVGRGGKEEKNNCDKSESAVPNRTTLSAYLPGVYEAQTQQLHGTRTIGLWVADSTSPGTD